MTRLFLTSLMLLQPVSVPGAKLPLSRWAVMATDEVIASGLSELLIVELSQNDSIELVEREQLELAMRELQLSALIKADQVSSRLQLGRTLKARALLVLSFEREEEKRLLRVVVCDADLGVRLWEGSFPFPTNRSVEQLVQHCAATVDEVRQRFADGVRHIIAVPAFLSDDFEHRYDYLQSRYSNLLSSSLMSHAGVAVVEIEEARAILRELETTLSGGLERPITSVVKASYQVTSSDKDSQQQVALKIDIADGNTRRKPIRKTLNLSDVGNWLTQDFVDQLLATGRERSAALSPAMQIEILSRHAQQFAELGHWEQSIALREAALVLKPNDALQRALLISEYQHRFLPDVKSNWARARFTKLIPTEVRERAFRLAAYDYQIGLDHLAYLIRNQLIGRTDAIGLLGTHTWYKPPYVITAAMPLDPLKLQFLQPAIAAQRKFLRDVYPQIVRLPAGRRLPKHMSEPFYGGQYVVTNHVVSDVGFNGFSVESLDSLRELLTRHLAGDAQTSNSLLGLLGHTHVPKSGHASYSAWIKLLTELSQSDRETARLYGRYALSLDRKRQLGTSDHLEQLLAEVKELRRADEPIHDVLNLQLMRPKEQQHREPTATLPRGFTGPLGRMQLEPIPLVVSLDERSTETPGIVGMLRCGEVDAYWSKDRFFIMHQPDVLHELNLTDQTADHDLFREVAWDGEFIWLHAYGKGIIAVQPDGTELTSFKRMCPSYSRGHRILGLSPGRALVVGSFGESNRAWCGMLERSETGQPSVNVFFEAKNVPEGRTKDAAAADVTTVFQPEEISRVKHADGRDFALIGRRDLSLMLIDLESLDVSVPEKNIRLKGLSTETELGFLGRLFVRDGLALPVNSGVASSRNSKRLLYHDGWLYRPGYVWMRQNVESGQLERLQAKTVPHRYWNLQTGSSAHYGLVTYDPFDPAQPFSRVTILDESNRPND